MTLRVVWSLRAEEQLEHHVADRNERRGEVAARTLAIRILDRLDAIAELPWSAPRWRSVRDRTFRRLVIDDFIVIYRLDEPAGAIQILSFRHGRQRPPSPAETGAL